MPGRHLLVTNDFPPKVGGIQAYLWELWSRLDPESFVVLTATSHPDASEFDAEQARRGIRIERVPHKILFFPTPAARARIRGLAREVGASLVLLDPVLPLGLLGPALGMPYGVVLHGAEVTVPARVPGTRSLLARVLGDASMIVSAGAYPAAEASRVLARSQAHSNGREAVLSPVRPSPLHVEIPPGVDCARFAPMDDIARRAARVRLGLPLDGLVVASVSRLVPRKGMDVLIEAARRLRTSYPDLLVVIAGTGRDARRLADRVRSSSAPVRLLGRVSEDDKSALLGASDVFAMACRRRWGGLEQEGFGIVFLEAAACGIAQVAGDSGGAADAVVDGSTGIVVRRPQDPADVAAALRQILADAGLRRRMGEEARRRACSDFEYDALAAKLAAALAEVQG